MLADGIFEEIEADFGGGPSTAPKFEQLGEAYSISNNDSGIGGHVTFAFPQPGDYAIYLSQDTDLTLTPEGRPNVNPDSTSSVTACPGLAKRFQYPITKADDIMLVIGPTDKDPIVDVVILRSEGQ